MNSVTCTSRMLAAKVQWPVLSIDFEASGLGEGTYPIEAGVAVWDSIDHPIYSWSSLITETAEWKANGLWHPESELIHNIPRTELASGNSPREVMSALNHIIGAGEVVFCDGGRHDEFWLRRLEAAAGIRAKFSLEDWIPLLGNLDFDVLDRACRWAAEQTVEHRAGPDAESNLKAFSVGLGINDLAIDRNHRLLP